MYDPDMLQKARDDDNDYYTERAAVIDAVHEQFQEQCAVCGEDWPCTAFQESGDSDGPS